MSQKGEPLGLSLPSQKVSSDQTAKRPKAAPRPRFWFAQAACYVLAQLLGALAVTSKEPRVANASQGVRFFGGRTVFFA